MVNKTDTTSTLRTSCYKQACKSGQKTQVTSFKADLNFVSIQTKDICAIALFDDYIK